MIPIVLRSSFLAYISLFMLLFWAIPSFAIAQGNKDKVVITGKSVHFDKKNRGIAIFKGNVIVRKKISGSILKAEYLRIVQNLKTKKIIEAEAKKNVYLKDQGRKLTTQYIFLNRNTGKVVLEKNIKLNSLQYTFEGEKVYYNLKTKKGRILSKKGKKIRFVFLHRNPKNLLDARLISGEAKSIQLNLSRNTIRLIQGQVSDPRDQTQFSARQIDVYFGNDNQVHRIFALGNFRMKQKNRISKSQKANFLYKKQTITLIGKAEVLEENQAKITAEKIEMHMVVSKGVVRGGKKTPIKVEIPIN
ncbi:MAG: lipopolysaccharide export system protein LptA [bacterium]|jgi:lipopolysaccharide export system protein LptA